MFDATGGVVSGHTLKHLLVAAAIGWLLRMLDLSQSRGQSLKNKIVNNLVQKCVQLSRSVSA